MNLIMIKTLNGLITANDTEKEKLKSLAEGEFIECSIKHGKSRSLQQLNLYWAACSYIANNTENVNFDTAVKVSEQCKINAKFYECFIFYNNVKTGQQTLNVKTKSISFVNVDTDEVNAFFTEAFKFMAELFQMIEDEFINAVKSQMCIENLKTEFKGEVMK